MRPLSSLVLRCSIASDLDQVDIVCGESRRLLEKRGLDSLIFPVDLLLREFLNNAIIHGNRFDPRKKAHAVVRIGSRGVVVRIRDEGRGFDWRKASLDPPKDTATSGRGLAIGQGYAWRMRFNRAGNQVTLWIGKAE